MALDTNDKEWIHGEINRSVGRSRKGFNTDMERHVGIMYEKFKDDLRGLKESIDIYPRREEVWAMIYEDGRKRQAELDIFKEELIGHRRRIETLETA